MMGLRFPQTVSTLFEKTAYLEMPSSLANMQTSLVIESPFGVMFVMSIWGSHSEKIDGDCAQLAVENPLITTNCNQQCQQNYKR